METRAFKPYFIVIGLLAVTSLLLAFSVDVRLTDEAGVKVFLPDRVGRWTGEEMLYCQNPACQESFLVSRLKDRTACPKCSGKLDGMTLSEKEILPPDTVLLRKYYTDGSGHNIYTSIVLSGKERASIHRPQICLVGQGNEITHSSVLAVPIEGRDPLNVMTLEMLRRARNAGGQTQEFSSFYAYWFVGKGRETPYHVQRMIWMATDRILHNVSHRWAYIAVSGARKLDSQDYQDEIREFIGQLYPKMALN